MVNSKSLSELSTLASELNSQSNNLNALIQELNNQLAEQNLGIEFWLDRPLESTGVLQDTQYSPPRKYEENTYLGYDKLEERWQLALKYETIEFEWNRDEREAAPIREYSYAPLLKGTRDMRLMAVEEFDNLIDGLKKHVTAKLSVIKRAEELAQLKKEK
jgi:hypothetical protein